MPDKIVCHQKLQLVSRPWLVCAILATAVFPPVHAQAEIHIYGADHVTGEVVAFKEDGTKVWSFPNKNSHDVQVLANGNTLISSGAGAG